MYGNIYDEQMADKDIKVIHQFLVAHNFRSTAESLIKEASKLGFPNLERELEIIADPCVQLMFCYDTGDYLTFFQLWSALFPESIKQCEKYKKLTFYLRVHFAVLPKRKLYDYQIRKESEPTSRIEALRSSSIEKDPILQECKENNANEIEKRINNSMKQLQDYLNEDAKELEYDTELQPFYALPFIEDFYADTFFASILEQHWLDELTSNLESFIMNHRQDMLDVSGMDIHKVQSQDSMQINTTSATEFDAAPNKIAQNVPIVPNDRDIPIFLEPHNDEEEYEFLHETDRSLKSKSTQTHITGDQMAVKNPGESVHSLLKTQKADRRLKQCNQQLALTKIHLSSVHTNYEKLKVRFHKLHADYHKLIDVAGELTVALENSVKGQAVDIQRTLEICMKIFPDLFNQNMRETSYPSLLQFARTDVKAIALPKLDVTILPTLPKLLDYRKIKLHLLNGDVKTKLLLLQALRWKITLAQPIEQDDVLHEYINRDLLGLHGQIASDCGKPVLPSLLTAGEAYARHLLQQFTARLLNALASFRCGRDYLCVGSIVVNVTFACLDNNYVDGVDPYGCDMMMAMLQKLSLRRQQRIYMMESGLLEWLINHLHDKCRVITLYRLEYATALLMNLSLHRLAQARASKIASLLVSTLLTLLSLDHASSLPYINGALNNFLRHPVIDEEARKSKRLSISDFAGNEKTAEVRKHLDHVLRIQKHEIINTPQNDETGDDDDNEELDVLENEIDENDPLQNYVGELNGETLLTMCYSVSSKVPQDAINTDTILQRISTTNSNDFYDSRHSTHVNNNKRSSCSALRDSSETIVASSMALASVRENGQTETEKFSSIASLNANNYDSNVVNDATWKNDSELAKEEAEAFLAKPKLSRTPP